MKRKSLYNLNRTTFVGSVNAIVGRSPEAYLPVITSEVASRNIFHESAPRANTRPLKRNLVRYADGYFKKK